MSHHESAVRGPDSRLVDRMLFFSDAVFAIVLTLLVIELKPPTLPPGAPGFDQQADETALHIVVFAMSFALVSIFWAAHIQLTRRLIAFDWAIVWTNLLFLFPITLMPFASSSLMAQGVTAFSWRTYSGVLIAASIAQTLLWLVAARGKGRLMLGGVRWQESAYRVVRALAPGIAFAAGYAAASAGMLLWAVLCWVLIFPIMLLAGLLFGARHPQPA